MTSSRATTTTPAAQPAQLSSARQPLAAPTAVRIALILALLVGAVGVIFGRDALIECGAVGGRRWIAPLLSAVSSVRADDIWLAPTAAATLIAGLSLIVLALAPRRRTHRSLTTDGVWVRRRDVTTLIADSAAALPGVAAVRVRRSLRRQNVTITPNLNAATDLPGLRNEVSAAVDAALAPLSGPPKIAVSVRRVFSR